MNAAEAKSLLLLYRPGTPDADDPAMAEALALAKSDPELAAWLEAHCARHAALRGKFQQIAPPAGLKEQIISEAAAGRRRMSTRRAGGLLAAGLLLLLLLGIAAAIWHPRRASEENGLTLYQNEMVSRALRGYLMDLATNNAEAVRAYLTEKRAPGDFVLPAGLLRADLAGCSVENWQGTNGALLCFRTGKPLPPGVESDLWLFVVDRSAVKDAPEMAVPKLAKVNRLITATWTDGKKLYFLGVAGEPAEIKQYL